MDFITIFAAAAAVLGVVLGAGALISPEWASRFVRLKADPAQPDGYAEFRATFGGVFLLLHLAFIAALYLDAGLIGASGVLCAGWAGAAGGRLLSLLLDGAKRVRTQHNVISLVVEIIAAIAFALPVVRFVTATAY
ncbi:hypothetical protein [Hyphobacterium marinum]|uniref:DUF4345 domain-containing protein n=1 Tax=Hyphobacterium marinum TaxID=3116574 RepID=A0ABU7LWN6_9PROT|nr:hypothetical protein [Hyphobacterium sp. Y6023]MEE2565961.1 hypothetical protein [Hyphobacterium sp. Y6023]